MANSELPFASTLDALVRMVPEHLQAPRIGIVCGSGLSTLVSSMREVVEVPYTALEGFAKSTGEFQSLSVFNIVLKPRSKSLDIKVFWHLDSWEVERVCQ